MIRFLGTVVLGLGMVIPASAQGLNVTGVSPVRHALAVSPNGPVVIDFDKPVDPAAFTRRGFMVWGRWSGVVQGELTFENNNTRARFTPNRPFSAGERITVSLARHVRAGTGETLGQGYAWQFWVRALPASLVLNETARLEVRRANEEWIQTYGAYAGDLDGDGYTDFAVPNERTNDVRVFMNDGSGGYRGGFSVYPVPQGDRPSTNEGADFNLDGHIDLAVGNSQNDQMSVFLGRGDGQFQAAQTYTVGMGVRGLSTLDLNGDGYMDLVTANDVGGTLSLLLNDGDGTFTLTENLSLPGLQERATDPADINGDGLMDLFVGALGSKEMFVLLGNGQGGLEMAGRYPLGGESWMIAAGDVNGDGHADVVSANSRDNEASVLLGDGTGALSVPRFYRTGSFPLAIDLGDLDGDGDLDMVTSNYNSADWTLYENFGNGDFVLPRTLQAAQAGSCAVLHDRNNDGTLDMTGIDELSDQLFLFTNTAIPTTNTRTDRPITGFAVDPAYPNPFQDQVHLILTLDQTGPVHVAMYDALGRYVHTLLETTLGAGRHTLTWDGMDAIGNRMAEGRYFARIKGPEGARTQILHFQR